jgi:4-oxalmesaconate hydratase
MGFVGCNLNPDPSGARWTDPPLTDKKWWYPLYEKMAELDVPAMIHVSGSCNPNFHHTGAHYICADTTAFMQLILGDLFRDFPTLKFIIPHGGGAVPYQAGIDCMTKVVPHENVLFASEMVGAVRGIDPETGNYYDDTKRYVDATPNLDAAARADVYENNARHVFPRLGAILDSIKQ